MQKIIRLSLIFLLCSSLNGVYSQCNPDFIYSLLAIPGIWPDATIGINDATVNKSYSQTLTVIVPKDTSIDLLDFGFPFSLVVPVNINSFTVDGITGLPSTFIFECGNTNCIYSTGEIGCLVITGKPNQSMSNQTYNLTIDLTVEVDLSDYGLGAQSFPYPMTGYELYVRPSSTNINEVNNDELHITSFHENIIEYFSPEKSNYIFDLYNTLGQKVYSVSMESTIGANTFTPTKYIHGILFYSMHNAKANISGKFYFN